MQLRSSNSISISAHLLHHHSTLQEEEEEEEEERKKERKKQRQWRALQLAKQSDQLSELNSSSSS